MAINNRPLYRLICASLFFLVMVPLLEAQVSGYFLDPDSEEPHFVQRLAWVGDEYTRRYEVIIEKEDEEAYRETMREFTAALFIDVSLEPGKYRFRVIPHDYLDRPGEESDWVHIEVRAALKPQLDETPLEFIYDDNDTECVLIFSGKDIDPNAEFYLCDQDGALFFPVETGVIDNGSRIRLGFDKDTLPQGDYELFVKNPGGLETSKTGIVFVKEEQEAPPGIVAAPEETPSGPDQEQTAPKKLFPFDAYLSAAWAPVFPLYGSGGLFFGQSISPVSFSARFGTLPKKTEYISVGFELGVTWCAYDTVQSGAFEFNLLAQKPLLNQNMSLRFRCGAGLCFFALNNSEEYRDFGLQSFSMDMGISFLTFLYEGFFIETGLDFVHLFADTPSGCFRPWFGLGLHI